MDATFTVFGYDANPRTRIIRIVAVAEGIAMLKSEVVPRQGINKASYMERFPLSQGKIPAIEGPGIKITETIAITMYLSKLHNKSHLLGSAGTIEQEAAVLSYASWANQELLAVLARWFLPLIPGFSDPAPYDFDAIEKGKTASLALLSKLETEMLMNEKGSGWLVGDGPTLADIVVAIVVGRGLQWVLGRKWREGHPNIMAHFETVRNWDPVKTVIPHFDLTEEGMENVDPASIRVEK